MVKATLPLGEGGGSTPCGAAPCPAPSGQAIGHLRWLRRPRGDHPVYGTYVSESRFLFISLGQMLVTAELQGRGAGCDWRTRQKWIATENVRT